VSKEKVKQNIFAHIAPTHFLNGKIVNKAPFTNVRTIIALITSIKK